MSKRGMKELPPGQFQGLSSAHIGPNRDLAGQLGSRRKTKGLAVALSPPPPNLNRLLSSVASRSLPSRSFPLRAMATTAPPKKKPRTTPLLGTHNGTFHCDEALAIFLLRLLPQYGPSADLIRTRDPALLEDGRRSV